MTDHIGTDWAASQDYYGDWLVAAKCPGFKTRLTIAKVIGPKDPAVAQDRAHLIAAAPDLLKACQLLLDVRLYNGGDQHADAEVRVAMEAIAKANGQYPEEDT